jgi:hypothetical protein
MDEAIALLRQLAKERFFGAVTLKFEFGKIVVLKKEETIKPQPYRENRGQPIEESNN